MNEALREDEMNTLRLAAMPGYRQHSDPLALPGPGGVWVIDDSATIRAIVAFHLRQRGILVQPFATGVHALHYRQAAPVPQLILLDIELPHIDGYGVVRFFRAWPSYAHTAIVLMSGHDSVMDRIKGRLIGANDSLSKPFTCQALIQMVSCYLGSVARPMKEQ